MKKQQKEILAGLEKMYPDVYCALHYSNVLELAVAVILSAQCTDARVNKITPKLFARCKSLEDYINIPQEELERLIYSTGFYKNKAKNIKLLAHQVQHKYGGEFPQTLDEITKLAGIGRKTGNVILGDGFGISEGVVVDTHVLRNSYRLGFASNSKNAVTKERELMKVLPRKEWYGFSHRLVFLGREYCIARKPHCSKCPLAEVCPRKGVKVSD